MAGGMARTDKTGHAQEEEAPSGGLLKAAARAIGSAVGIAAAKAGMAHPEEPHGSRTVNGKFQKSHKHRLPRRLKKVQKKALRKQKTDLSIKNDPE
jgi:hypothetical protein